MGTAVLHLTDLHTLECLLDQLLLLSRQATRLEQYLAATFLQVQNLSIALRLDTWTFDIIERLVLTRVCVSREATA